MNASLKRVLITGEGSFVGTSVQKHLNQWPDHYVVTVVGTKKSEWKKVDFSSFDVIYHVAGVAHSDNGNISEEKKNRYYAVNSDLAIDVAKKAKESGCSQFIFMSSMIVYGDSASIGRCRVITAETPYSPTNCYGDSKVRAEKGLMQLNSDSFRVVILRCPMIYGEECKGNFPLLEKLALRMPFFPKVDNKRSMLYIRNLAEFVRLMIDNCEFGVFWPCNREQSNTSELVQMIAACHGKRMKLVPGFCWVLKLLGHFTGIVNKAFGNMVYEDSLGNYKDEYRLYSLEQSIKETERLSNLKSNPEEKRR